MLLSASDPKDEAENKICLLLGLKQSTLQSTAASGITKTGGPALIYVGGCHGVAVLGAGGEVVVVG